MFCAALIGSHGDRGISDYFHARLDKNIFMAESESAVIFNCPGVTVVKKFSEADLSHCPGTIIVSSENTAQLKKLLTLGNPVITCGTCSKDTITFTSRTEDSAVIAVQRSVGGLEAPCEIPVSAGENEDIYYLMALETVRMLASQHITPQA